MKILLIKLCTLFILVALVGCSEGPRATGGTTETGSVAETPSTTPSWGAKNSATITAQEFVSALNSADFTVSTSIEVPTYLAWRAMVDGKDWFVIWDDKDNQYKAVNLQFLRSITYYDFTTNNLALAKEFRRVISAGGIGNDQYEIVDRNSSGDYIGRSSGYEYEDELPVTDVSLLAYEKAREKFIRKAANVSFLYNVSIETSLSMVTLGEKLEKMLSRSSNGELTQEDQLAIVQDMKALTGVSLEEIQKASNDNQAREEVLVKIANKLGTTTLSLEQKLLPEVFGITL